MADRWLDGQPYDAWKSDVGHWPDADPEVREHTCPHGVVRRAVDQVACDALCRWACEPAARRAVG